MTCRTTEALRTLTVLLYRDADNVRVPRPLPQPPAPVWIHFQPGAGHVIDCSGGVQEQLLYSAAELRSQPLRLLADPHDWQAPDGVWRALSEGEEIHEKPLRVRQRGGGHKLMNAYAVQLNRLPGRAAIGLLQLHDIGERWPEEAADERDRQRLRTLAYEITLAESRERERLAQRLHDDLGQLLAVAQLRLSELDARCGQTVQGSELAELRDLLSQAATATRATSFELYAPLLQPLGFRAALEALAERATRQAGLQLELAYTLPGLPLADALLGVLLRVVRELLANVRKHAAATAVRLVVTMVGRDLQIELHDNGRGLPPDSFPRGFGLSSAEAQMQALGGRLEFTSRPGRGTTARLRLPIRDTT